MSQWGSHVRALVMFEWVLGWREKWGILGVRELVGELFKRIFIFQLLETAAWV